MPRTRRDPAAEWLQYSDCILDDGADDELLAIMARDNAEPSFWHRETYIDGEHWWANEQRRNPLPTALLIEAKRVAEVKAKQRREVTNAREREQRRLAREQWQREQAAWKQQAAARDAELQQAARDAYLQQHAAWLALLQQAADEVRGTQYEAAMLGDLERDIATVKSWPKTSAPPGQLHAGRFRAEFNRRMLAAGATPCWK